MLFLAAMIVGQSSGCHSRITTYVLSADIKPGWVIIEHGNKACGRASSGTRNWEISIPADGFVCTSEPVYEAWEIERYEILDRDGRRVPLDQSVWVHYRSRVKQYDPYKVDVVMFYYGRDNLPPEKNYVEALRERYGKSGTASPDSQ